MNINRNFVIIFGISTLLIITIFGLKAYYQERESQTTSTTPEGISFKETFDKNYPASLEEAILLNKICSDVNVIISRRKQEFEPLLCAFVENKNHNDGDKYTFVPSPLKIFSNLPAGQYITIAVNYSDLLQENVSIILPDNNFNLCAITKPALIDPFREQLLSKNQINVNRNIVLPEGEIFCSKFFSLPSETLNLIINGFVPETDLFEAKMYLVPEDKEVDNIFSQESFSDIEEILQSYPILWNIEKPTMLITNQN